MTKSQLHRLYCYKAFGYKYVDEGFLLDTHDSWFDSLETLKKELKFCNLCELSKTRNSVLVPSGSENAKLMIVFESPSINDDLTAKPYSSGLGEKFLELFKDITGLSQSEYYTTFLLKCKISQNKKIDRELILKCAPFLNDEIRILKPKLVLCVGELVSKILLRDENLPNLTHIHGSVFKDGGISYIPTFGASYVVSNPSKLDDFKSDLAKVKEFI